MSSKTMDERVTDLEKLAETLAPMPLRMQAVEGRLGVVETRLGVVETRLGTVETRLGTVESQIVQLRTEMRVEFSAVRHEMADGLTSVRTELRADIADRGRELAGHILATQRQMRVMHEEVIKRIALIGEGRAPEA